MCGGTGVPVDIVRATRVYPRVCGGTGNDGGSFVHHLGLSPRVRGNPGAGNAARAVYQPVYPRVCGGTCNLCRRWPVRTGLSPRVRGNLAAPRQAWPQGRSIPACAGEPAWRMMMLALKTVYPRVCGGTSRRARNPQLVKGLSPRVRGNPGSYPPPLHRPRGTNR